MTTSNSSSTMTAQQYMDNYYVTTNTSTSATQYTWSTTYTFTTNYQPYISYVYDTNFTWRYTADIEGLRQYLFANNSYRELGDILYDMYLLADDDQEFEDSLYSRTLDLLYEITREEIAFELLLNEKEFPYQDVNKILYEIIDSYRNHFQTEEF